MDARPRSAQLWSLPIGSSWSCSRTGAGDGAGCDMTRRIRLCSSQLAAWRCPRTSCCAVGQAGMRQASAGFNCSAWRDVDEGPWTPADSPGEPRQAACRMGSRPTATRTQLQRVPSQLAECPCVVASEGNLVYCYYLRSWPMPLDLCVHPNLNSEPSSLGHFHPRHTSFSAHVQLQQPISSSARLDVCKLAADTLHDTDANMTMSRSKPMLPLADILSSGGSYVPSCSILFWPMDYYTAASVA